MIRLLFAKAIDDHRTAIVIDTGYGSLLGGVVEGSARFTLLCSTLRAPYSDHYACTRCTNIVTRSRLCFDLVEAVHAGGV